MLGSRLRSAACLHSLRAIPFPVLPHTVNSTCIVKSRKTQLYATQARLFSGTPEQQTKNVGSDANNLLPGSINNSPPPKVKTSEPSQLVRIASFSDLKATEKGKVIRLFAELSKARLGALVVASTIGGFCMAPVSFGVGSVALCAATAVGTSLCIASANTINQVIEVHQDTIMRRTFNRPIAAGRISRNAAFVVGVVSGGVGVGVLHLFVNPLTAGLGFLNILLYTCAYTPMKQMHYSNTWVGALVGAIPPMMGWTAVTNDIAPGAWILFSLLYLWQMPHFFSLSWLIKDDYSNAGFKMLVCEDPARVARLSLTYSLSLLAIAPASCAIGLTDWGFLVDSSIVNSWMIYEAYKFNSDANKQTARSLFLVTLLYLPILMGMMIFHKRAKPEDTMTPAQQ